LFKKRKPTIAKRFKTKQSTERKWKTGYFFLGFVFILGGFTTVQFQWLSTL